MILGEIMKHILYVSRLAQAAHGPLVPRNLLNIYKHAKRNNQKYNITGLLSYKEGYYLQAIEGPDQNVDALFRNILRDKRHTDVLVLVDQSCEEVCFRTWGFESSFDLGCNPDFAKFSERYRRELSQIDREKKELLSIFYKSNADKETTKLCFRKTKLRLRRWPDLTNIEQTPSTVHLCTNLLHRTWRYEDLVSLNKDMSQRELNTLLKEFRQQQTLRIIKPEGDQDESPTITNAREVYKKVRSMFTLRD